MCYDKKKQVQWSFFDVSNFKLDFKIKLKFPATSIQNEIPLEVS